VADILRTSQPDAFGVQALFGQEWLRAGIHVSALICCMSMFRQPVSQSKQWHLWAMDKTALTRASTRLKLHAA
jgi:hypothetical protein